MRSQAEEVRLRFRTTRPSGLLLATSTEQIGDRLQVAIFSGRLRLHIRLGEKEKVSREYEGSSSSLFPVLNVIEEYGSTVVILGYAWTNRVCKRVERAFSWLRLGAHD
ncbi:unnamed protein product [Nesidiocoris tenuis]|uniref:Laminin G domain-containing protein n=1 Tax=Nesidiocoris tenuis TaxID=355587 RepID=A0A6H5GYB2_9HEMI|nr:unnamed protein product [Nesidiocoris tenuis]